MHTQNFFSVLIFALGLRKQWNKNNKRKDITAFLVNKHTQEFIEAIAESEEVDTRKVVSVTKGGKVQGTWMHPFLFIYFAMWINNFPLKPIKLMHYSIKQGLSAIFNNSLP
jgi:hypothetical protein